MANALKFHFILITILLIFAIKGLSQQQLPNPGTSKLEPVPPSPQAASLGKYGEVPINYRTGIPGISIPISAITLNDFSYPVSLNYHAMGNKVDEVASNVGLGWSLSATGSISGSTKGNVNELPNDAWSIPSGGGEAGDNSESCQFLSSPPIQYQQAMTYLEQHYNFETSRMAFNFAGFSGKLMRKPDSDITIIDQGQSFVAQEAAIIPSQNLKIYFLVNKILAIDENGVRYYFENYEVSSMEQSCNPGTLTAYYPSGNESYFLTRILTPNSNEINFTYTSENYSYVHSRSQNMMVPFANNNNCEGGIQLNNLQECTSMMSVSGLRLLKIEASNGQRIEFSYSARADLYGAQKLDGIKVFYNSGSTPIEQYRFYTSYFGGTPTGNEATDEINLKMRLDSLQRYIGSEQIPSHRFFYQTGTTTPRVYKSQDYFGYANGAAQILFPSSIIPGQPDIGYQGANREPNLSGTSEAILIKIKYPTAGYSEFDYQLEPTGGLRIKYIKDFNYDGILVLKKHFKYENAPEPTPIPNLWQDFRRSTSLFYPGANPDIIDINPNNLCYYWTLNSNSQNNDVFSYPRSYPLVEEIYEDNNGQPNGKTSYGYGPNFTVKPASLFYNIIVNGATSTHLSDHSFLYEPLGVKIQWRLVNNAWVPVHKIEYEYEVPGIHEFTLKNLQLDQLHPEQQHSSTTIIGSYCRPAILWIRRYQYVSTWYRQKKIKETHYDSNGLETMKTETEILENEPTSLKPKKIKITQSNGQISEITYKYPADFGGLSLYDQMVSNNIVGPVVTERQTVGDILVSETVTRFDIFASKFKPASIYSFDRGTSTYLSSSVPEVVNPALLGNLYHEIVGEVQYDNAGNVTHIKQSGGKVLMFKWGYANQYFVASKEGTNSLDFYFTSFEEVGQNGTEPQGTKAQTGNKVFSGNTYTTGFQPAQPSDYEMSYWYYANNVWQFTGVLPFSTSIITQAGATYLDEIRIYPKGSLITTYTYDFGKGATTATDPNNKSTHYDYDQFNRLYFISDGKRNMLSKYMYNYKK